MTEKIINDAQDYLVINYGTGKKKILDIVTLLQRHPAEAVIQFMKGFLREKQKIMRRQLLEDKTNPCLDEVVATIFRIGMAITVLERESEVNIDNAFRQRSGEGGELH